MSWKDIVQPLRRRCIPVFAQDKSHKVCEGGGISPWTGSAQDAVGKSPSRICLMLHETAVCSIWTNIKLTCYPCSSFFFCLIKTDTFLLHLLSDHFYWVLGRSLYHFSHPVIFNLLLEQNRDEDIIHIQKCCKKPNILSGLSITTVYNSDESFGYPY